MSFGFGFGLGNVFSGSPRISYDADAQALFDAVGDVPTVVKPYFNSLIVGLKAQGVWDNPNFWGIFCVPSLNAFNTLIEIKSRTIVSSFADTGSVSIPYNTARQAIPTFAGYSFRVNGRINTGFIPSASQTLNNSSEFLITYTTESASTTFNYGALNSASQENTFSVRQSGGLFADAYNTTIGTGRINVASVDGAGGVYIKNRRSSSYMSVVKNGTVIGSITGNGGSLPSIGVMLNCYNNAGTPSTRRNGSPICGWGSFGSGLTASQETGINTVLSTWQTSMQRLDNSVHTKQIILDGNSHTVYWFAKMMRTIEYNTIVSGWKYSNFGVSGQKTTDMSADYATEIAPLYNGSLSKNILIAIELTNDWHTTTNNEATVKSNFASYVSTAQATGFSVIVSPMMCRAFSGNAKGLSATDYNLGIDSINQWLLSGGSGANHVTPINPNTFIARSDYGSDAAYNTAVAALLANTSVFYDQIHLTENEYKTWGDQLTAAVQSL